MNILVKRLFAYNNLRNFTYIIYSNSGEAWVIDPYEASQVKDEIKALNVNLRGILNTHDHTDHTRGNAELQSYFGCDILDFGYNKSLTLNQDNTLEILPTPGHTPEHIVFLWKRKGVYQIIFAGDTLFNAGVGNCKNGGNVEDLFTTTEMLRTRLPEDISLQPGHDYLKRNLEFALMIEPSNKLVIERLYHLNNIETELLPATILKEEVLLNPFFRLDSEEIRSLWLSVDEAKLDEESQRKLLFKILRSKRDNW